MKLRHAAVLPLSILAAVLAIGAFTFLQRMERCGFSPVYARGTITGMEPAPLIAEPNPHSTTPDYYLARRPVVKLESEAGREAVGEPERMPGASYTVGDRVAVCYDRKTPRQVYILGRAKAEPAQRKSGTLPFSVGHSRTD